MNQVIEFFTKLFQHSDWLPQWKNGHWSQFHGWLYIISDIFIWLAYFSIPVLLLRYIRQRKNAAFIKLYIFFSLFILACGTTYLLNAVSFWFPFYRINALFRFTTAFASWVTVFYMIKYLPDTVSLRTARLYKKEMDERLKIESKLRESEDQIQAIYKNAPEAIIVVTSKGNIVKWNPAAEKMFGWKEDEVLGKVLNELVVPENLRQFYIDEMKGFLKTRQSLILNRATLQTVLHKDGSLLKIEFTVSPIEIKDDFLFIGFVRDVTEIRLAELALKESQERNRLLTTEVSDYAIMMLSPEGNIDSWNEGVQKITGYSEKEVIGKNFSIFYIPEAVEHNEPAEDLLHVNVTGRTESEGWRIKKDGTLFWANVVLTALKRDGKIIGYSKISKDITKRKSDEESIRLINSSLEQRVKDRTEELEQSEKKYRELFENSPMPMWVLEHPSLKFVDVNEAAIQHYGYSREEFLSMTAVDIRPDEEKNKFITLDRSARRGIMKAGTWKHIKKDKSIIYVEISSHELNIDNTKARLVLSIDVTERKKAEERLELALEAGKIGIWELDMLQDIAIRNARHDQIFGYEEMLPDWGMARFLSQVHVDDLERVQQAFKDALETGILNVETRIYHTDNTIHWINATARMMADQPENPFRMLGTIIDITEVKNVEERILLLNNDLEKRVQARTRELHVANKELESFTYSVSHDLRAPLRAIHGYTQLLNESYQEQLDVEGKRMLGRVIFNTGRMNSLIDDLLEFSRLGKASVKREKTDITKIAQEVVNELCGSSELLNEHITVHNLGVANVDKIIIRHVFENLISNAIKYSSKKEHPLIEIGVTETKKGNTFFVKDNGTGFDMNYYYKLFGVFQRLHRKEDFEGTGVGLAIVQKIITKHYGEVWAEGVENEGATFFFTIGK
ncbi:MAG: PAS domain S-box protein [Ferruginibacter sp.]